MCHQKHYFLNLTGSRHGRPAGHADVRGVLRLLSDDVSEAGPVPADDGLQWQEGPPDSGGAGQLPAQRAEGERSRWLVPIKSSAGDTFFHDEVSKLLPLLGLTHSVSAVCPEESALLNQSVTPKIGLSHGCPFLVQFSFFALFFSGTLFPLLHCGSVIFHHAVFTRLWCSTLIQLVWHGWQLN